MLPTLVKQVESYCQVKRPNSNHSVHEGSDGSNGSESESGDGGGTLFLDALTSVISLLIRGAHVDALTGSVSFLALLAGGADALTSFSPGLARGAGLTADAINSFLAGTAGCDTGAGNSLLAGTAGSHANSIKLLLTFATDKGTDTIFASSLVLSAEGSARAIDSLLSFGALSDTDVVDLLLASVAAAGQIFESDFIIGAGWSLIGEVEVIGYDEVLFFCSTIGLDTDYSLNCDIWAEVESGTRGQLSLPVECQLVGRTVEA